MAAGSDPARFRRVAEMFEAVRALPADEREPAVRAACDGDAALADEVLALLARHDGAASALDAPLLDRLAAEPPAELPDVIGRYRVLGRLGEGGMGVVYLAEQDTPKRTVALKVLKLGLTSPQMRRRFEHESAVLARLQHPGIAQVYDAGTAETPHGRMPYFAMEHVRGQPITDHADAGGFDPRARIELLIDVAHAVQHAHQHGVVHRDLKPANILVDDAGRPRILDFGVARSVDAERQATLATDVGQLVGTLPYMSPEQLSGRPDRIDTRSDVYALGVVAYELLAGRLPHDLSDRSLGGAVKIIEQDEPTALAAVDRGFRGDLDTIIAKTLEKDPDRRYETAAAFAADLRRFLDDQPIAARPVSTLYQLSKFARRHRAATAASVAALVVLIGGVVTATTLAIWALAERDNAETSLVEARREAYRASIAAADAALRSCDQAMGRRSLFAVDEADRAPWEWRHLAARLNDAVLERSVFKEDATRQTQVLGADIAPDGRMIVDGDSDGRVRFHDLSGDATIEYANAPGRVVDVAFAPDGSAVATVCHEGPVVIWDPRSVVQLAALVPSDDDGRLRRVAWAPDGRAVATASDRGVIHVWSWPDATHRLRLAAHRGLACAAFSPDGAILATGATDQTVRLHDVDTGDLLREWSAGEAVLSLAWQSDGAAIAGGGSRTTRIWDAETGALRLSFGGTQGRTTRVAWTPDDATVITAAQDGTIRHWDARTGQPGLVLLGNNSYVADMGLTADGRRIVAASENVMRLWDPALVAAAGFPELSCTVVAWADAIGRLATGQSTGMIELVDPATMSVVARWHAHTSYVTTMVWVTGGIELVSGGYDGAVHVWDPTARMLRRTLRNAGRAPIRAMAADTDGRRVAIGDDEGRLTVFDVRSGERLLWQAAHDGECAGLVWGRDDRVLVSSGVDGGVRVWDVETGTLAHELGVAGPWRMGGLAVSPDSEHVASTSLAGGSLWRLADGAVCAEFGGLTDPTDSLLFSPDGTRLLTASATTIRVRDVETGDVLLSLHGHTELVRTLAWIGGGATLVSGGADGVRVWDTRPPAMRYAARGVDAPAGRGPEELPVDPAQPDPPADR